MPGMLLLAILGLGLSAGSDLRDGVNSTAELATPALLLDFFQEYLDEGDVEAYRRKVQARYDERALARLLRSADPRVRRAAVFGLGLVGSYRMNAIAARGLRDPDPLVRELAMSALWGIWFRADTPENNARLEQIRSLIGNGRLGEATARATRLIEDAPQFAEAYNQRAIAYFLLGRFEESAGDCHRVLERNPYHFGALGGLGKCQLELGRRDEALATFRRALQLQPFDGGLRETIRLLETGGP
jgi:tetratricopeptide (TPR) repeat protein